MDTEETNRIAAEADMKLKVISHFRSTRFAGPMHFNTSEPEMVLHELQAALENDNLLRLEIVWKHCYDGLGMTLPVSEQNKEDIIPWISFQLGRDDISKLEVVWNAPMNDDLPDSGPVTIYDFEKSEIFNTVSGESVAMPISE